MESDNKYKYYCEYCGRAFERNYNLSRHLQNVHNRYLETVEDKEEGDASMKSDTESNTSTRSETESNASSRRESASDSNEWETYTQEFEKIMLDTFNETAHQLFPDDDEGDDDDDEDEVDHQFQLTLLKSKEAFRNKLKRYLNIVYGMQEDKRYDYLFHKIDRNMEKKIDFPVAIDMAVRSSAAIIDKDFENVISREMEVSTDDEQSG